MLSRLTAHNAQGEYYLTDSVRLLIAAGQKARGVVGEDYRELLGINTVAQLQEAERIHADIQRTTSLREEA